MEPHLNPAEIRATLDAIRAEPFRTGEIRDLSDHLYNHAEEIANPLEKAARLDEAERENIRLRAAAQAVVEDADLHEALPYYMVALHLIPALAAGLEDRDE